MRILFLSNRGLLPVVDGHTRRSYNILKGLAERNDVYLLFLYEKTEEIRHDYIKQLKNLCTHIEFLPAPTKKIRWGMIIRLLRSLLSKDPYTLWRHYSCQFLNKVNTLIGTGEFDIVHCDNLPLSYAVRNNKEIFCSVTDHDVSYLKSISMMRDTNNIFLKVFLYMESLKLKRFESRIFNQVDLGIVVSENDMNTLKELCPKGKFIVIENGVEIKKYKPRYEFTEKNKLVWLGGFDHYPNKKGIRFLLKEIYPLIKQKVKKVSLDIVGGGVTKQISDLAKGDNSIAFIGYVEDPLPYLQKASVFLAPLLSGGGTKLKVLEAMAVGKAIVTTSFGIKGIEGVDGEHYIVANTELEFAEAVVKLLRNDTLNISMGKRARKLIEEKYDYDRICEKLNKSYNHLLNRL